MSEKESENKGIIDQISDYGKKMFQNVKDGFSSFTHPSQKNEDIAPKLTTENKELFDDKSYKPGTYSGIEGKKKVELESPFEHSGKEKFIQQTRDFGQEDMSRLKSYVVDSVQKTKENSKEFSNEMDKDKQIEEREHANKDQQKVKDYGFNPVLHEEKKEKAKLEKLKHLQGQVGKVKEKSELNYQGNTRSNEDDLYAEVNKMPNT